MGCIGLVFLSPLQKESGSSPALGHSATAVVLKEGKEKNTNGLYVKFLGDYFALFVESTESET